MHYEWCGVRGGGGTYCFLSFSAMHIFRPHVTAGRQCLNQTFIFIVCSRNTKMKKAKDIFRIRVNIMMGLATVGLCLVYIWSGKRAVQRGDSIHQMNRDRHSEYQQKEWNDTERFMYLDIRLTLVFMFENSCCDGFFLYHIGVTFEKFWYRCTLSELGEKLILNSALSVCPASREYARK